MMEHKAYLFGYDDFEVELRPLLENALTSEAHVDALESFIEANLSDLRDPYEGERLKPDWRTMIENWDAHQLGDFALTKFYDPTSDIGLGNGWEAIQDYIAADSSRRDSPILGVVIGPEDNLFDPGKMGSYFQSAERVRQNFIYLSELAQEIPSDEFGLAIQMLEEASKAKCGLYVTF